MIKTIVYDIGGVFLHPDREQANSFWSDMGMTDPSLADHVLYGGDDQLWDVYKRGGMSEQDFWQGILKELPVKYEGDWQTLCRTMEHAVRLDTELAALTRALKTEYPVHALSNAGAELERRLGHFGITDLFGHVINSYRVKMAKPDEAIFRYTCEVVGAEPGEILFVDDKERNTSVAKAMGYYTHVYTDADSFRQFLIEEPAFGLELFKDAERHG